MRARPAPSPRHPARFAALAAALGLLLLFVGTGPATAHGGDGELEVLSLLRQDAELVEVSVRLTYVADGHGVPDATVTATVDGATPVTLDASTSEEGVYTGDVAAPAGAVIRITSVDPAVIVEAEAPSAGSTPSSSVPTETTETTETTEAPTTTVAPSSTTEGEPTTQVLEPADDDGDSPVLLLAGGAGVVAVAGVAGVIFWRRRGGPGGPDGDGAG